MLHDDAGYFDGKIEQIAGLPIVTHAVEQRVAAPFEDVDDLITLELHAVRSGCRAESLLKNMGSKARCR